MKRLILLSAILITSCSTPYIQPKLPLPVTPPFEQQYIISAEEEEQLKTLPTVYIKVVRQKQGYKKRIETLEGIIRSTH